MAAVDWLARIRGLGHRGAHPHDALELAPVVRTSPGLAALFESVEPGRKHSVLDLGAASEASLAVYSEIERQVRFADLASTPWAVLHWDFPLEEAGRAASEPTDVLLAWDTLGRLPADGRARMVARLAQLAAPSARLHMVLEGPDWSGPRAHRFGL